MLFQTHRRVNLAATSVNVPRGIRGDLRKLIWRTPLPSAVELYDIRQDPSEKNDVAARNPEKVAALQKRANELAATMAKPMLLQAEFRGET